MKRILVALDFGPSTEALISFAGNLANDFAADVQLIHVHKLFSDHGFTPASFLAEKEILNELQIAANTISILTADTVKTRYQIAYDTVESSILNAAKDVDLILVGQTLNKGLWRFITGDISEGIVENASCPVLVIPPKTNWVSPTNLTVAADRYEVPDACISFLAHLKKPYDSKVNVFHQSGLPLMELPSLSVEKFKSIGAHVQEEYSFDSLTNYLLDCAEKSLANWLVVIHHRRPRWKEWLSRNESEKIADASTIPVLILPDLNPVPEEKTIQTASSLG